VETPRRRRGRAFLVIPHVGPERLDPRGSRLNLDLDRAAQGCKKRPRATHPVPPVGPETEALS
jgi:hypothetical protein